MELKKSAVDLTELAISIIILGIVVSIGGSILITYRNTKLTDLSNVATTLESITPSTAGTDFANQWANAVSYCQNGTGAAMITITSGNYSLVTSTYGTGSLKNLTSTYVDSAWKCNYTWGNISSRADYLLANQSAIGLAEYGNWFKIIVITGVAALILGIIFLSFGRGSSGIGQSSAGEIGGNY